MAKARTQRPTRAQRSARETTYARAYLATLGGSFVALAAYFWTKQIESLRSWPSLAVVVLVALVLLGAYLVLAAWLASPKRATSLAESASTHEISLVVMLLAAPVYFVLRRLSRKRN